eukprot:m.235700 g.235700  ORF g.235700 m.235700 type:complete len:366 (+) comp20215_c0_seq1:26-1123(+)
MAAGKLDREKDFVRMCVVGCGNIAKAHLAAIGRNYGLGAPQIAVTCLCDPNEKNLKEFGDLVEATCGARPSCFATLEEALAKESSEFDAVNICVPNDLHEQVSLRAFAAGKHVLLEKPIALDTASAQRILEAARAAGTVFMVAENAQYWKEILVVKKCLDEKRFGEVVTVRAKCWESTVDQNEWQGDYAPGLWRSDPRRAGGGYVFDSASHWIRPLRIWVGPVTRVVGVHGRCVPHMQGESFAHAILAFDNAKFGSLEAILAPWHVMPQPWFVIECTQGELVIDGAFNGGFGVKAFSREHPDGIVLDTPGGWDSSYEGEMADFAAAVLLKKPLAAGPESAVEDLRILLALFKSAATNAWVNTADV